VRTANFLLLLTDAKRDGGDGNYKAKCPVHSERTGSLHVTEAADRILLRCFGCDASAEQICTALGIEVRCLFFNCRCVACADGLGATSPRPAPRSRAKNTAPSKPKAEPEAREPPLKPITLAELAAAKRIPEEFLREQGADNWPDGSGVCIGYFDHAGEQAPRLRHRSALKAKAGSKWYPWESDAKLIAYGAWRRKADLDRGLKYLIVTEGESNCWGLWRAGFAAIGVPGATLADVLTAADIEGANSIFITEDPDSAGVAFVADVARHLRDLNFKGPIRVLRAPAA
jgi:hypothetical protein